MAGEIMAVSQRPAPLALKTMTREQVELLKATVCRGATDDELQLFVHACNRLQLDPFCKQIHAVKRWDGTLRREVMAIQVGIDGLRLNADRTGQYRGQLPTLWCDEKGTWTDTWISDKPPFAAKARVLRDGWPEPVEAIARWSAYVQTTKEGKPNSMWAKRGAEQLAKCAEALALRMAFPQELSGVYAHEEMDHAGEPTPVAGKPKQVEPEAPQETPTNDVQPPTEPPADDVQYISEPQRRRLFKIAGDAGKSVDQVKVYLSEMFQIESTKNIPVNLYDSICQWAEAAE